MLPQPRAQQPTRQPALTRRGFLLGVVGLTSAGTLAGCGIFGDDTPTPAPLPTAMLGFYADTAALADRYQAALTAVPALAGLVTPVHDNHVAHRDALARALGAAATGASPTAAAVAASPDRTATLADLVAAESAARDAAVAACAAAPDHLASLVGAIAAARATHLIVLS